VIAKPRSCVEVNVPFVLVALKVNELVVSLPTAENPLTTPVLTFNDAPVGKLPLTTLYVMVLLSASVAEYVIVVLRPESKI
jgi:hypothetical protein